uniref:Uncharacterized protein n=1 Tax=Populus alba TaxID=43335 RepID=A0A4U5P6P4_POPAL|nr:hypothetical protein D5086_0000224020 [Populus alba]
MPPSNVSSRPIQLLIFRRPNSVSVYPIQDFCVDTKLQELAQNLGHASHYILTNSDIAMYLISLVKVVKMNYVLHHVGAIGWLALWVPKTSTNESIDHGNWFGRCNLWNVIPQLIEDHKTVRFRANAIRSPFSGDYWLR